MANFLCDVNPPFFFFFVLANGGGIIFVNTRKWKLRNIYLFFEW